MIRIIKGPFWVATLLLVTQLSAQQKGPASLKPPQDTEHKAARSTGAGPDASAPRTKDAPDGKVDLPEAKAAPAESPQRVPVVGRRDPFRPITLNLRTNVRRRENLSPLEQFEVSQLNLVGIIRSAKDLVALVEDNIGRGYTVRVGTPIGANDGKVKMITPVAVLIEEDFIDLYGAKKKREVSMRLPPEKLE